MNQRATEAMMFGATMGGVLAACAACVAYAVKPSALALAAAGPSIASRATVSIFVAAELTLVAASALVFSKQLRPIVAERVHAGIPFGAHRRFWRTAGAALAVSLALPFACALLVNALAAVGAAGSPVIGLSLAVAIPACAWGLGGLRALSSARTYDPANPRDAEGAVDFEDFRRTCLMPRVRATSSSRPDMVRGPEGATVAQRGQRFVLGWADSYFGIWDSWAPSEPARRFAQDPAGWRSAWGEFSLLEPNAAVRARGSWPSL